MEDRLTPAPRRIAQQRQSPDHTSGGEHLNGQLVKRPLKREITAPSTSSQFSILCTLEETGEGAGIVHFRGLEGYTGCDGAWHRPYIDSEDGSEGKLGCTNPIVTPTPCGRSPKTANSLSHDVEPAAVQSSFGSGIANEQCPVDRCQDIIPIPQRGGQHARSTVG